ncbi:hypothetical protein GCM10009675_50890 [Prauserella alba]|uniref:Secreted protein n=1 Tax=Prauserella alba TaxID=176898 RepID=A0ABP4GDX4_9PSEU
MVWCAACLAVGQLRADEATGIRNMASGNRNTAPRIRNTGPQNRNTRRVSHAGFGYGPMPLQGRVRRSAT